jgi:hypothetical protein
MSSDRRVTSSRANAKLSTGPKTEAGKRRSSRNGLRHGCRSRTVILDNESPHEFDQLLQSYLAYFQPANPVERDYINQMAIARWRMRRLCALETSMMDKALLSQPPEIRSAGPDTRIRIAFLALLDVARFRALLDYQNTQSLTFHRAIRNFLKLRKRPPNPTTEATLSFLYVVNNPRRSTNKAVLSSNFSASTSCRTLFRSPSLAQGP